jgi:hypothetical protein
VANNKRKSPNHAARPAPLRRRPRKQQAKNLTSLDRAVRASTLRGLARRRRTIRLRLFNKYKSARRYKYRKQLLRLKDRGQSSRQKKTTTKKGAPLSRRRPASLHKTYLIRTFKRRAVRVPTAGTALVQKRLQLKALLVKQRTYYKRCLPRPGVVGRRFHRIRRKVRVSVVATKFRKRNARLATIMMRNLTAASTRNTGAFARARFLTTDSRRHKAKIRPARLARAHSKQTLAWGPRYRYYRPQYFTFNSVPGAVTRLVAAASRLRRVLRIHVRRPRISKTKAVVAKQKKISPSPKAVKYRLRLRRRARRFR